MIISLFVIQLAKSFNFDPLVSDLKQKIFLEFQTAIAAVLRKEKLQPSMKEPRTRHT
jgi:hypothetical protein